MNAYERRLRAATALLFVAMVIGIIAESIPWLYLGGATPTSDPIRHLPWMIMAFRRAWATGDPMYSLCREAFVLLSVVMSVVSVWLVDFYSRARVILWLARGFGLLTALFANLVWLYMHGTLENFALGPRVHAVSQIFLVLGLLVVPVRRRN